MMGAQLAAAHLDGRDLGQRVEVTIAIQNGERMGGRAGGDQAVDARTNREAAASGGSIELGGIEVEIDG